MKKFGKIFGVVALAVATLTAGAVGLSGCGKTAKLADVEQYVYGSNINNELTEGYKFEIDMPEMIAASGAVVFKQDGTMEFAIKASIDEEIAQGGINAETYLKDSYLYVKESQDSKYTKTQIDFTDVRNEAYEMVETYTQFADLTSIINDYMELCKELENFGLKTTKTEKDGVVEFKMTYREVGGKFTFALVYTENRLTKLELNMYAKEGQQTISAVMKFELFSGEIDFPADLDSNVETMPEEGGESGDVISGEELAA